MYGMFSHHAISFNQPIGNWNMSAVTNVNGMLCGASSFNQPIDNWQNWQIRTIKESAPNLKQ